MQFLQISANTALSQLRDMVGSSNVEAVLAINGLKREPNIGAQVQERNDNIIQTAADVSIDFMKTALNKATQSADVFEALALMGMSGWKVFQNTAALPGTLAMPNGVALSQSANVLGNLVRVSAEVYDKTMQSLASGEIDPGIFNPYSADQSAKIIDTSSKHSESLFQFFRIPWGKMTIYSSIANDAKDFPVYPTELGDIARANYTTMPEIIYQYEPWQLYNSSGPRNVSYSFFFHRDMWTGDHRDGMANALVRFCQAQCYPEYNGSAVNTAYTTLYMNGEILVRGVVTEVQVNWEGPLGLDNFPLVCNLQLSFVEVSPYPLDYWTVMNKPIIG